MEVETLPSEIAIDWDALRTLKEEAGPNKHHQAIILIHALISHGINTGKRIIGAMVHLGFDARHAGKILSEGTGENSERYHWRKDKDRHYSSHLS